MDLYLYADDRKKTGKRLRDSIEVAIPWQRPKIFRSIEIFKDRLRYTRPNRVIAVLLANSRKDLLDFISIDNLLSDVRIILIVPDQNQETIALGHSLFPRYLSFADSDFTDVTAVLRKMIEAANKTNNYIKEVKLNGGIN